LADRQQQQRAALADRLQQQRAALANRADRQLVMPVRRYWDSLPDRVVKRLVEPLVIMVFSRYHQRR